MYEKATRGLCLRVRRESQRDRREQRMKKLVAIGAMLALMMMAAVPAFASAVAGDVTLDFVDASQTQAAAATQTNEGDATAGDVGSAAAINQELTIEQSQVNAGWGGIAAGEDIVVWWWW
jgi:hypothetical protein